MTPASSSSQRPQPTSVMGQMVAAEYERLLETLSPQDPDHAPSSQQIAHAKTLARRNVLDRLEVRGRTPPPAS